MVFLWSRVCFFVLFSLWGARVHAAAADPLAEAQALYRKGSYKLAINALRPLKEGGNESAWILSAAMGEFPESGSDIVGRLKPMLEATDDATQMARLLLGVNKFLDPGLTAGDAWRTLLGMDVGGASFHVLYWVSHFYKKGIKVILVPDGDLAEEKLKAAAESGHEDARQELGLPPLEERDDAAADEKLGAAVGDVVVALVESSAPEVPVEGDDVGVPEVVAVMVASDEGASVDREREARLAAWGAFTLLQKRFFGKGDDAREAFIDALGDGDFDEEEARNVAVQRVLEERQRAIDAQEKEAREKIWADLGDRDKALHVSLEEFFRNLGIKYIIFEDEMGRARREKLLSSRHAEAQKQEQERREAEWGNLTEGQQELFYGDKGIFFSCLGEDDLILDEDVAKRVADAMSARKVALAAEQRAREDAWDSLSPAERRFFAIEETPASRAFWANHEGAPVDPNDRDEWDNEEDWAGFNARQMMQARENFLEHFDRDISFVDGAEDQVRELMERKRQERQRAFARKKYDVISNPLKPKSVRDIRGAAAGFSLGLDADGVEQHMDPVVLMCLGINFVAKEVPTGRGVRQSTRCMVMPERGMRLGSWVLDGKPYANGRNSHYYEVDLPEGEEERYVDAIVLPGEGPGREVKTVVFDPTAPVAAVEHLHESSDGARASAGDDAAKATRDAAQGVDKAKADLKEAECKVAEALAKEGRELYKLALLLRGGFLDSEEHLIGKRLHEKDSVTTLAVEVEDDGDGSVGSVASAAEAEGDAHSGSGEAGAAKAAASDAADAMEDERGEGASTAGSEKTADDSVTGERDQEDHEANAAAGGGRKIGCRSCGTKKKEEKKREEPEGPIELGSRKESRVVNYQRMAQLLREASEKGYVPARVMWGFYKKKGVLGIDRDEEGARTLLEGACEVLMVLQAGDPLARLPLALISIEGLDGEGSQDKELGTALFERLLTEDDLEATYFYAYYLWKGVYDIDRNVKRAVRLMERAAGEGHAGARAFLGDNLDPTIDDHERKDVEGRDQKTALEYVLDAAWQGVPRAAYVLARMCWNDFDGVDVRSGLYWVQKAIEGGVVEAKTLLAYFCIEGACGAKQDDERAWKLLEEAYAEGDVRAASLMAWMIGVQRLGDYSTLSCCRGCGFCLTNAWYDVVSCCGMPRSINRMKNLLEEAAAKRDPMAQTHLAQVLDQREVCSLGCCWNRSTRRRVYDLLQSAADPEKGNWLEAQLILARAYDAGNLGLKKSPKLALDYWVFAAEKGDFYALVESSKRLVDQVGDREQDWDAVLMYAQQAAEMDPVVDDKGNPLKKDQFNSDLAEAAVRFARILEQGDYGAYDRFSDAKARFKLILSMYEKAKDLGYERWCSCLRGIQKDITRAENELRRLGVSLGGAPDRVMYAKSATVQARLEGQRKRGSASKGKTRGASTGGGASESKVVES